MVTLTSVRRGAGVGRSAALILRLACQQTAETETTSASGGRHVRVLESEQSATVRVAGSGAPYRLLNFSSANYLGLTDRVAVSRASAAALQQTGAGLASGRGATGTCHLHLKLEEKLAVFHGRAAAIAYSGGWDANVGLFCSLFSAEDTVLSDVRCCPSTRAGITLCNAKKHTYRDMEELESQLVDAKGSRLRVIASDGVFECDANFADLPQLLHLAEKHSAYVILDESHAAGITGRTGRGTEEVFGQSNTESLLINGSLSTALGGAGGSYTTGPQEVIALLRLTSKPYLSSCAMAPPVAASAIKALDLVMDPEENSDLLQRLHSNARHLRARLSQAGFTLGGDNHPVCPVYFQSRDSARTVAEDLFELGVLVAQSPPHAPPGVRAIVTSTHTRGQLDCAIDAFYTVGQQMALVPPSPYFQNYTRRNPEFMDFVVDDILKC